MVRLFIKRIFFPLVMICVSHAALADLLLFSDNQNFHGCLDCGKYDSNSVCNKFGNYGSKYSSDSIWNKYGVGSKYNSDSPFSKYGQGLKIVDRQGGFYGYLSRSYVGERKMRIFLNRIWDAAGGDYDEIRVLFCDQF